MPTNFPASNDVFSVPSVPASTPLGSTGTGTRTHTQHHGDMGDALDAMQVEQVLLAHSHDGVTTRHGVKLAQANTHQSADTDSGPTAIHHTIGAGANQYASGTHTHPAVVTYPVGAFLFLTVSTDPSVLGVAGIWTAVGQRFLCASGGGLGLTAGTQGGSNSHSHTIDASTNSQSSHSHSLTSGTSSAAGAHAHAAGAVNGNGAPHLHSLNSVSLSDDFVNEGSSTNWTSSPHSHTSAAASGGHSHSSSVIDAIGDHTHNISGTGTTSNGSHSHTNSTPATANNLVPLFAVYMWKRVS